MSTAGVSKLGAAGRTGLILRWVARAILIAVAAFWIWFGIADGLADAFGASGKPLGLMGFLMMLPAPVVALIVLYVAWRWELIGGIILLAITLFGACLFAVNMQRMTLQGTAARFGEGLFGLCIFVLPFLAAAVCLLIKTGMDRAVRRRAA